MAKDCNLPKPGRPVFRTDFLPGKGYLVRDPEGCRVGEFTPSRIRAEQLRDRLQREADAKAKRGPRACLSCGSSFVSEGIHNRLCSGCRSRGDGSSMSVPGTSNGKVRRAAWA